MKPILRSSRFIIIIFLVLTLFVYKITSSGNTPYDYFTRLADSFLHGKYYLEEKPSWLTELIPAGHNKFYVVYPPMPAIILMPFVYLFGKNFPQQLLAHAFGAGLSVLTFQMGYLLTKNKKIALWSSLLIGLGSIVWYMSASGSVWFLGQISAAFFLTAALVESLSKKRFWIVAIFLGSAYLSRTHTILSLPLFIYLLKDKITTKNLGLFFLGISPFILFDFYYNFIRYGVPWNKGYFLLPAILNETNAPWFIKGVANPLYIPDNLRMAFWSFPKFFNHPPYIQPSWAGMAIWITTPAFIYSFFAKLRETVNKLLWLAIVLIFLVVGSHGGTGFAQFGYRFAVDFYPFLTLLTIKGIERTGITWHHYLLIIFGVLVNLWGVLWINKFGWVGW